MNPAILHRQHGRAIFWIAFMTALAVHLGAVALAKAKSPTAKIEDLSSPGEVDLVDTREAEPVLPEESVTHPPLEQIYQDQDIFTEENAKPPRVRAHRNARATSFLKAGPVSLRSMKGMVMYAPRPVYPYEARRQRITGSGVALLTVNETLGDVTDVVMTQGCGNAILDNATLDALRRWRFKPGCPAKVRVPFTYTLMGVSY